jgi:hypothetical protein
VTARSPFHRVRARAAGLLHLLGRACSRVQGPSGTLGPQLERLSHRLFPYEWAGIGAAALYAAHSLGWEARVVLFPTQRRVRVVVADGDWDRACMSGAEFHRRLTQDLQPRVLRRVRFEIAQSPDLL